MRKAFPQVPPSPKLEAEWCPAWSCFFPRQTNFQVPFQIWAILGFHCTRFGSLYEVQLQPSMVKLGVILIPDKHGILLPGSIPAPMGFTHAATGLASSALVLIFPCMAGGDNQHLFLSELDTKHGPSQGFSVPTWDE